MAKKKTKKTPAAPHISREHIQRHSPVYHPLYPIFVGNWGAEEDPTHEAGETPEQEAAEHNHP